MSRSGLTHGFLNTNRRDNILFENRHKSIKSRKALWNYAAQRAIQMEANRVFIDDDCFIIDVKENVIFQTDAAEA